MYRVHQYCRYISSFTNPCVPGCWSVRPSVRPSVCLPVRLFPKGPWRASFGVASMRAQAATAARGATQAAEEAAAAAERAAGRVRVRARWVARSAAGVAVAAGAAAAELVEAVAVMVATAEAAETTAKVTDFEAEIHYSARQVSAATTEASLRSEESIARRSTYNSSTSSSSSSSRHSNTTVDRSSPNRLLKATGRGDGGGGGCSGGGGCGGGGCVASSVFSGRGQAQDRVSLNHMRAANSSTDDAGAPSMVVETFKRELEAWLWTKSFVQASTQSQLQVSSAGPICCEQGSD